MFTAQFAVPGSIVPSHHCLISATSGGTQIPLERAKVVFGMYDSDSCLHVFRQSAFLHPALPLVLFPLSMLADAGCFFDFYGTVGLSWGDIFLPFQKQDGLYLAPIFPVPFDSPVILDFIPVAAAGSVSIGLPAVTRSSLRTEQLTPASPSLADPGYSPFPDTAGLVPLGEDAVLTDGLVSLPADFTSHHEKDGLQPLRLTGDGARLFAGHRRYGHMHDRAFKRMVDAGLCGGLKWVKGLILRENCWDCLKGQQTRKPPAPGPNLDMLHPLACQIMVWDWCGPHHVTGLHGELYWFLAVCPRGYHWGATATKKTEFIIIIEKLLRHVRGLVGDDRVRFVKFDGAPEFITETVLSLFRAWKIDYNINCPAHHWQTGAVERGHLTHQNSLRTMASYANTPSVLWGPEFLLSVQLHNLQLHRGSAVSPYFDLTGMNPDTQFIFIWGCFAVVHNHAVNPNKFHPRGLPCVYVGTGSLENVNGAKFLDPSTGKYIFSTNMTIVEHFLPFREVLHNPAAVRDCFGVSGFRNMVGWLLVNNRVRKCFDGTWHIGIIRSFNLRQQWFVIQYSDGLEEYTPSEVALVYFGNVLPRAFYMAFEIDLPLGLVAVGPNLSTSPAPVEFPKAVSVCFSDIAFSATAGDELHPILACLVSPKMPIYRTVVHSPLFPLAGPQVLIPATDRQAQQQVCAPYWNASKNVCLNRHRELNAHTDVDRPDSSVQVLNTKWVFDLKICPEKRTIERFKARVVANGKDQLLGFDCFDVNSPTLPICELKMLLAIAAARNMELFHLDTTTAFISAQLKPGEEIYCNPPRDIDIGIGANGLPRVWKLNAPLEGTRPAAMRWYQSSAKPITSFGFVPIGCGGAFWLYLCPPHDSMLLGTHVDDFMVAASSTALADKFAAHFGKTFSCKKSIAREFVGMHIIRDRAARKIYLSQALLIDRLLETEFDGIMQREGLTGNDLRYNPGHALHKWEALCPCSTPFDSKMSRISVDDCPTVPDPRLIHWMQVTVGVLLYTLHTRPDIMHSVHQLSRIVHNPGPSHVKAVDHLLRYLAGTVDLTFVIGNWTEIDRRFASGFHGNADASHKNAELNYRGITGVAVFFLGTLVLSRSFVQAQVADSSCECEYYAYSTAVKDMEYVRLLIRDLAGLGLELPTIPTLYADCEPAIAVAKGVSTRSRTKHIDFKIWLCRDYVRRELVQLVYMPTDLQIADFFTKQLGPGPYILYRGRFMSLCPCLLT